VFKNKSDYAILNTMIAIQPIIFDLIMNTNNTKAVIYARVSSQNDRQDTARQVADLTRFALSQEMEIVKTFEEHISGAKKLEEREILTQCLDYCKNNSVNYLLISELSRLGRSTLQVLRSLEILHEAKVCVYIQNIGLYSLQHNGEVNPVASIMITILAEMSNIERSNIQYRLNSGRQQYINRGGKLGRRKGSVKTVEQKKEEYKEVISLLKRGYSIRNVAKLTGYSIQTVQTIKNQFVNNN
jgi:DNA invertase Pin-like site-specific DNA recombinase